MKSSLMPLKLLLLLLLLLSIDGRGVLQDEELNWQLRDMNYFISHGGLVDQSTLRKLKR